MLVKVPFDDPAQLAQGDQTDSSVQSQSLWGVLRRKARTAIRLMRTNPAGVLGTLVSSECYVVYSADPRQVPPPEVIPGASFERLADDMLLASLPAEREETALQREYLRRRGFVNAYAVRLDGTVAHVSWLITPELERHYPIKVVKLRPLESEITNCVTLKEFRGRGLYPYAIRKLCQMEAARGTSRVFMVTSVKNIASQRGMQKAGLSYQGRVVRLIFRQFLADRSISFRGHRWFPNRRRPGFSLTELESRAQA
jgi:hypothetical protein